MWDALTTWTKVIIRTADAVLIIAETGTETRPQLCESRPCETREKLFRRIDERRGGVQDPIRREVIYRFADDIIMDGANDPLIGDWLDEAGLVKMRTNVVEELGAQRLLHRTPTSVQQRIGVRRVMRLEDSGQELSGEKFQMRMDGELRRLRM